MNTESAGEEPTVEAPAQGVAEGAAGPWSNAERRPLSDSDQRLLAAALRPSWSRRVLSRACNAVMTGIMAPGIPIDVDGLDNVPSDRPFLLVSNHQSHLDTSVIRRSLGWRRASRLQAMAARDYFFTSGWRTWFFSMLFNVLPFDRLDRRMQGLEICQGVLDGGCPVLLFPEGTRSKTGEMRDFRGGLGIIASKLNYEVVPTHVSGTFAAMPPGRRLPRPGRIRVRFGPAIRVAQDTGERSGDLYREASRRIQEAVAALAPDAQASPRTTIQRTTTGGPADLGP